MVKGLAGYIYVQNKIHDIFKKYNKKTIPQFKWMEFQSNVYKVTHILVLPLLKMLNGILIYL
jgi:hypothetical protein